MGNDLNDLEVMQEVGFPVCPADAHEKIRRLSNHVTKARGGEGGQANLVKIGYI